MRRKNSGASKTVKELIKAIFGAVPVMILCLGILTGVLIESGTVSLEDIRQTFGFTVPAAGSGETPSEYAGELSVNIIDVGQGDCALICAGEKSILIDAGEKSSSAAAAEFIRSKGITRPDYIIATHPHADHIGGMADIINEFGGDKIIVPRLPDGMTPATTVYENFLLSVKDSGGRLTAAKAGTIYDICTLNNKAVTMTVLSPTENAAYSDLNDYSVCVRLDYGRTSWFFGGDLSEAGERDLIASGADIDVTAYKVSHHGSSSSSSAALLDKMTPRLCVISCGAGNSYGHPNENTLERLKKHTDSIYRTDISGTVTVVSDGERLYVTAERRNDK